MTVLTSFVVAVAAAALILYLQYRLSRADSPVPGLILPCAQLIVSVVLVLGMTMYSASPSAAVVTETVVEEGKTESGPSGEALEADDAGEAETASDGASVGIIGGADGPTAIFVAEGASPSGESGSFGAILMPALGSFLLMNVPTTVLLGVYFAVRGARKRRSDIEKATIQDL